MVSSDGVGIPEHYWLGAVRARDIIGQVLTEMLEADELDGTAAQTMGRMILHDQDGKGHLVITNAIPLDGQGGLLLGSMSIFWEVAAS